MAKKQAYRCELIQNGVVVKRFFRTGESAEDVRDGLELFEWPDGEWRITAIEPMGGSQ